MKIKIVITAFLITVILVSCSPPTTSVPIATILPTHFPTATPIATFLPVSPTPQATIPSPITFSGEGNAILTVNKWRGPALIHINHEGTGEFSVWNLTQNEHLLNFVLFAKGKYSGTQVLDFSDRLSWQTYYLEIGATGNWEIEILPFEYGRRVNVPGVFTGTNNDVVFLEGGLPSSIEVSIYESGHFFALSGVGNDGFIPISDGTPPYHGVIKIEQDVKMLIIECIGEWQVNVMNEGS